jgi:protein-L-isoaspartate(D-aspartate) O-methyltransferase
MVRDLEGRGIRHRLVLEAMGAIPRARFVDEALRGKAYDDVALPIGDRQTISQPWVIARMTELLEPDGEGRVLEIGTGSGYHAAVLSRAFGQVYTVERLLGLSRKARENIRTLGIENVHFKVFDGSYGWSEFAPYRGIVVTAAAPEVPAPLIDQLSPGGWLVMPLLDEGSRDSAAGEQRLVRVRREGGELIREEHEPCRFVPLVGRFGFGREGKTG